MHEPLSLIIVLFVMPSLRPYLSFHYALHLIVLEMACPLRFIRSASAFHTCSSEVGSVIGVLNECEEIAVRAPTRQLLDGQFARCQPIAVCGGFRLERWFKRKLWLDVFLNGWHRSRIRLSCLWCFVYGASSVVGVSSEVGSGAGVVDCGSSWAAGIGSCAAGGLESMSGSSTISTSSILVTLRSTSYSGRCGAISTSVVPNSSGSCTISSKW